MEFIIHQIYQTNKQKYAFKANNYFLKFLIIHNTNHMKASSLFTFLGGAALGALVALLIAPDSGSNTRKKLRHKLKEHGIDLNKEEFNELIDRLKGKKHTKEAAS